MEERELDTNILLKKAVKKNLDAENRKLNQALNFCQKEADEAKVKLTKILNKLKTE